jgi:hypothetical protein
VKYIDKKNTNEEKSVYLRQSIGSHIHILYRVYKVSTSEV